MEQIKIKAYKTAKRSNAVTLFVGLDDIDHVDYIETDTGKTLRTITLKDGTTYYTDMQSVSRVKKAILNSKKERG